MSSEFPRKTYKAVEGVAERAQPFIIETKENNDKVVIIVHGFTSSPSRLHWVADKLSEEGYDVDAVLLAGHGSSLEKLRHSKAQEWLETVETAVAANVVKYKKVYILGYSFGANLAVHACIKYPQVRGLVTLGIPLILNREKTIKALLPIAKYFVRNYKKNWLRKEEAVNLHEYGYQLYIPVKALVEFRRLVTHTKKEIAKLQVPVLIGHSRQDKVASSVGSQYFFDHLTVKDKSMYIMNQGNHREEEGVSRDFIVKRMIDFLKKH